MDKNFNIQHQKFKSIISLGEEINMPSEMLAEIKQCLVSADEKTLKLLDLAPKLACSKTAGETYSLLAKAREEFEEPAIELAVWLNAAVIARGAVYKEKAINNEIFIETMKTMSRFVREHKESFGEYGFDRGFWIWRQTSGLLFRLGTLEFEIYQADDEFAKNNQHPLIAAGKKYLSVHIPSDSKLSREEIDSSYDEAKAFFARYFPEDKFEFFFCSSWMLSPTLKSLLNSNSSILSFAADYEILLVKKDSDEGNSWIFKTGGSDIEKYPTNTSLQRKAHELILNGGHVGSALGIKII